MLLIEHKFGTYSRLRTETSQKPSTFGDGCRTGRRIRERGPGRVLLRQFIFQNHVEQRLVDPNPAFVLDVPELSKTIHEEADAGPSGTDHLRKSLLRHLRYEYVGRAGSPKVRHQQQGARETSFAGVE